MTVRYWIAPVAALLAALSAIPADAEQGVSDSKIVVGQVAPLEGPVTALGRGVRAGLLAAFGEANANGGVGGRKLELITRDDGYEPELSVAATRRLIEDDHVFALVGGVGTPSALATAPVADEAGVPFVAPFTGAAFLREPPNFNVVNLLPSYFEEAEFTVNHLIKDRGITRIGIFYEDDAFGHAGLAGLKRALEKHGLKPVAEGSFVRNTLALKVALATIRKANPEAVVMIAPYGPCAEFVKLAHRFKFAPLFVANSMTGLVALSQEIGPEAEGIFLPQWVPSPDEASIPAVAHYRAALAALDPKAAPDTVSFEGYLAGRLVIAALQNAGAQPTRKSFLAAIFGHKYDIDGVVLDFPAHLNQAVPHLSLVVIGADGKAKSVAGMTQ
jgi:ABC-type branched-subunit amino acid transport system substrate-binding protein